MFKSKNELPMWEMVYNFIKDRPVGDVITYEELSTAIKDNILNNRKAVLKARKILLIEHRRYLRNYRGKGYEVVEGLNIMGISKKRHQIAAHQINTADFETSNINLKVLNPEEKKKVQDFMAKNNSIRLAFKQTIQDTQMGLMATREQLVGAEAMMASAQITQLFTEKQLAKLKELIGE